MLLRKKHLRVACQVWKMLLASKFRQTTSSFKICCKFVVYKFCKKKNCQNLALDLENVILVLHSFIYKLFIVKSRKNFRLIKYFRFPTLTTFSFLTLLLLITGLMWLPPPINQPIKFSFWPKSNFFLLRNGKSLEWKFVIL